MSDTSLAGKDGQFYIPNGGKFVYQNPMALRGHSKNYRDAKKSPSPVSLSSGRAVAPVSFKPPKKGERSSFEVVTEHTSKQNKSQDTKISAMNLITTPLKLFSSMLRSEKKTEKPKEKPKAASSTVKASSSKHVVPKKEATMAEPLDTGEEASIVEPTLTHSMGDFESPRKRLRVANKYKENDNWKLVNARKPKPKPNPPPRRPHSQSPIAMIKKEAGTSVEMIKQVENQQGMLFTMKEKSNTASFRIQSAEGIAKETKMLEKERKKNSRHSLASQRNKNPTNAFVPKDMEKPKNIWKRSKNVQMPPPLKMRTDDLRPDTRDITITSTIESHSLDKSNSNQSTVALHEEMSKRDDVRYKPAPCKLSGPGTPDYEMLIAKVASGDKQATLPKKQNSYKRGYDKTGVVVNTEYDKVIDATPFRDPQVTNSEYGVKKNNGEHDLNEPRIEKPKTPEKSRRGNITNIPVTYEEPVTFESGGNFDGKPKPHSTPYKKNASGCSNNFAEAESYLVLNYDDEDTSEKASESYGFIDNIFKLFSSPNPSRSKAAFEQKEVNKATNHQKNKNMSKKHEGKNLRGRSESVEFINRSRKERFPEGVKAANYIPSAKKKENVQSPVQKRNLGCDEKTKRLIEANLIGEGQKSQTPVQNAKSGGDECLYLKDLKFKTPYTKQVGDLNLKDLETPPKMKTEKEATGAKPSAKPNKYEQAKTPARSKPPKSVKPPPPVKEEETNNKESNKTPSKTETTVRIENVDEEAISINQETGIKIKSPQKEAIKSVKTKTPIAEMIKTPLNKSDNKESKQSKENNPTSSPKPKIDHVSKTPNRKQIKSPVNQIKPKVQEEIKPVVENKSDDKVEQIKSPSDGKTKVSLSDASDSVNIKSLLTPSPAKVEASSEPETQQPIVSIASPKIEKQADPKTNQITEHEKTIEEILEFGATPNLDVTEEKVNKEITNDIYKDVSPHIETISDNLDTLMETTKILEAREEEELDKMHLTAQLHFRSPPMAFEEDHLIRIPLYGKQQQTKATKRDTKAKANMLAPRIAENKWAASNKVSNREYFQPSPVMTKQQVLAFGGAVALPRGITIAVPSVSTKGIPSIIAAKEQRFHFSKCSGNNENSVIVQSDINSKEQDINPLQVDNLDNEITFNRGPSVFNLNDTRNSPVLNAFPVCTSLSAEHIIKPANASKLNSILELTSIQSTLVKENKNSTTLKKTKKQKNKNSNVKSSKPKKQATKDIKLFKSNKECVLNEPKKSIEPKNVLTTEHNKNASVKVPRVTLKSPIIKEKPATTCTDSPMANVTSAGSTMKSPLAISKGYASPIISQSTNQTLFEMFKKMCFSENSSLAASERGEVP